MKITIKEINFTIKLVDDNRYPDLLAYASIRFVDEHERHFTFNGFTIRKSKFNGKPYLAPPTKRMEKGFFKFALAERSLWKEIEKEMIAQYENELIPIIEEEIK